MTDKDDKVPTITRKHMDGLITEIGANRVLIPKSDADRAWNDAMDKAIIFVTNYRDGKGLFQL